MRNFQALFVLVKILTYSSERYPCECFTHALLLIHVVGVAPFEESIKCITKANFEKSYYNIKSNNYFYQR